MLNEEIDYTKYYPESKCEKYGDKYWPFAPKTEFKPVQLIIDYNRLSILSGKVDTKNQESCKNDQRKISHQL